MSELAIEVHELTKRYGRLDALLGVSFSVKWNSRVGLVGPNGSGKTTLLRILKGMVRPSGGNVQVAGFDAVGQVMAVRRLTGLAHPDLLALENLTPDEFLRFIAVLYGATQGDAREDSRVLLNELGMSDYEDRPIAALSSGQKKRVVLASAVVHHPLILLLDEPYEGLDEDGRERFNNILETDFYDEDKALVAAFPDSTPVPIQCETTLEIDRGEISELRRPM